MNIIPAKANTIKKIAVKIICEQDSEFFEGSGFIIEVGGEKYIITCAHCIVRKSNGQLYDNIRAAIIVNLKPVYLSIEYCCHDLSDDKDYAIFKTVLPDTVSFDFSIVHFMSEHIGLNAGILGFQQESFQVEHHRFVGVNETVWRLVDGPDLVNQESEAKIRWGGFSGSGLFYQESDTNSLYVASYLKGIKTIEGDYNEFVCLPISNICESLKSIELTNVESIENKVVSNSVMISTQHFRPLKDTLLSEKQCYAYISSPKTEEILNILRNEDEMVIQIKGLSGLGKTRLLYEAFRNCVLPQKSYYCKYEESSSIMTQFEQVLEENKYDMGLVIIDDCPWEKFPDFVDTLTRKNEQFRLISTNHDYFDVPDSTKWKTLALAPDDMTDAVDIFIEQAIGLSDQNRTDVEAIKRMSEGYPSMANELVKYYKEGLPPSIDVVESLMPKLLQYDSDSYKKNIQEKLMQTFSLCQPMPYGGEERLAFDYMIGSDNFTPLFSRVSKKERCEVASNLVSKYNPTIIEVQSNWLMVKPLPLAIWLTKKWFENCNYERMKSLIEELQEQTPHIQKIVSEGFCKHIQLMQGNKAAFELVQKLVDPKEADSPFLNEEVLNSGLGSRFFLAFSSVNPAAVAKGLSSVLLEKTKDWLVNNLATEARQNIVSGLEKLCFASESYDDAVELLAKLVVSQSEEHWMYDEKSKLMQLFHIHLCGTEVSFEKRIETLKKFFDGGADYKALLIDCLFCAMADGQFVRLCGAEKFGLENKKDYVPKTYGEINRYWKNCNDLLLQCLEEDVFLDMIAKKVENITYQWIINGRVDLLFPLLEKISSKKKNDWEGEYEELSKCIRLSRSEMSETVEVDVNKWKEKLRPSSFIYDLKDVRYEMWYNYRNVEDYSFDKSKEIFSPIVDKFINEKVYLNQNELSKLIQDKDPVDSVFTIVLKEKMKNDEADVFFNTIFDVVSSFDDGYTSSFLHSVFLRYKGTDVLNIYLGKLLDNSMKKSYVYCMAITEDESLSHLDTLKNLENSGEILDFIDEYLSFLTVEKSEQFLILKEKLKHLYPERINISLDYYLTKHYAFTRNSETLSSLLMQMTIDYDIDSSKLVHEYTLLANRLLETQKNVEYAKSINGKLIAFFCEKYRISRDCASIFRVLLSKYPDDVWENIMTAMISERGALFSIQVKDSLGSGLGFGAGPLFQIPNWEEKIKLFCSKYPQSAPTRIAEMAPCFKIIGGQTVQFSDIFIWLIDHYGDQDYVLSAIHSNLGTYSWSGSVIPYYRRNIICFKQLLKHKNEKVRNWAQNAIKGYEERMRKDQSEEDYMKLHYR